jgi:outer membrane protein assembly factor BamB
MLGTRLFLVLAVTTALTGRVRAGDWPQWRGPQRDAVCTETNLLPRWPDAGPKLLWKSTGLGRGYSAPIVVGERIFLAGDVGEDLRVFALNLHGERVWETKNGRAWTGPYPGARASCTFSEGRLFHLNAHGRLACLDAATGAERWAVNLVERFGAKVIHWGLSENVLVDGARVIVTAGGRKALIAALDAETGETVWASEPLLLGASEDPAHERLAEPAGEADAASYASPILVRVDGRRLLIQCSLRHVFGADADTGELLWSRPMPTRYSVIATTPVWTGDGVFVTAPDGQGGALYRLRFQSKRIAVQEAWRTDLDACQGGVVHVNGTLYGARYRQARRWVALNAQTGAVRFELQGLAKGAPLWADGRLYCLAEDGEVALLNPTANEFEFAGRFRLVPERVSDAWTHPVIARGRLFLRYHDTLFCFEVRAGQR